MTGRWFIFSPLFTPGTGNPLAADDFAQLLCVFCIYEFVGIVRRLLAGF
jgi:hypothetical protein